MIQQQFIQRWSTRLSYLLHPVVILWVCMLIASYIERENWSLAFLDAGLIVLGLLPGIAYIAWQYRRGAVGHPHLLLKEERRIILPILVFGLIGTWAIYIWIDAPRGLIDALSIGVIEAIVIVLITRYWKISLHAAVSMACAALFVPVNLIIAFILVLLALITGLARLPIRHHTVAQVVAGWIYGWSMTLGLLWLLTNQL